MTKFRKEILRLVLVVLIMVAGYLVKLEPVRTILFLSAYGLVAYDILIKAIKNIINGNFLDEFFLMSVATVGAIFLGEYFEAVEVMLLFQIGELFQDRALEVSRKSIAGLVEAAPEFANVERDGAIEEVDPDEVEVGEIIIVKPGEKVPIDGKVIEGKSSVNTQNITGESVPRGIKAGDEILSGFINLDGLLKVETTRDFDDSAIMKILELIENTSDKKSSTERFITRFSRVYTPIVVISALIVALLPPLITGDPFSKWVGRALIFLVVSCPCALLVSVPLAYFSMIGALSKRGVLVKGSVVIENISKARDIVFDKTGTLTKGIFKVFAIHTDIYDEETLLRYAAYGEYFSNHPIGSSIREEFGEPIDQSKIADYQEIAGMGIRVKIDDKDVLLGNDSLMSKFQVEWKECHLVGTTVHIAIDGEYVGHIIISDEIKTDSVDTIDRLKKMGFKRLVMLTGDMERVAKDIAGRLGLTGFFASLLPEDKVKRYEEIKSEVESPVIFVGDGLNDAPALAGADVGIAMGQSGSHIAIDYSDVVLMDDKPSDIALSVFGARKTSRIVKQNIYATIIVKLVVLVMAAMGNANMQYAIFADVGVMILATLNSFRAMRAD